MDVLSLAGLVLALVAVVGGAAAKGAGLSALWNFAAFLIVIVGTLGAVLLQSGLPTFRRATGIARWIVQPPPDNRRQLIRQVADWATLARKQGLLGLESQSRPTSPPPASSSRRASTPPRWASSAPCWD